MKLIKCEQKVLCDFGSCNNLATHQIVFDDVPSYMSLNICERCLSKLTKLSKTHNNGGVQNCKYKKQ